MIPRFCQSHEGPTAKRLHRYPNCVDKGDSCNYRCLSYYNLKIRITLQVCRKSKAHLVFCNIKKQYLGQLLSLSHVKTQLRQPIILRQCMQNTGSFALLQQIVQDTSSSFSRFFSKKILFKTFFVYPNTVK